MDRSMGRVAEAMAAGLNVRTGCPITHVDYSGAGAGRGVLLTARDGRRMRCRAVVITVPLPILQEGVITFSPPLPPAKQAAISRIRMGNVIKVILGFKAPFWPEDMYDAVSNGRMHLGA
jgi:monoamine oxidase